MPIRPVRAAWPGSPEEIVLKLGRRRLLEAAGHRGRPAGRRRLPGAAVPGDRIISATRDILTVGAELSLTGAQTPAGSHHDGTGGQRGAVLALVLVRRLARLDRA